MQPSFKATPKSKSVYLYTPNIIGYVRVILLILFLLCAFRMPVLALWSIALSAGLDALDGLAARQFNEITKFGTTFDFALDRASIAILELVLALTFPALWMLFASLLMLDIFSHLCQLYFTVFSGSDNHKSQSIKQGRCLQLYYGSRGILFVSCFSHDGFLMAWYGYHFIGSQWFLYLAIIFLPGFVFKILIHCLQISNTFRRLIQLDNAECR